MAAFVSRLEKLRTLRRERELSHILITDPTDIAYISGFSSSNAALLIGRKNLLFTDFRYHIEASIFCKKHSEWTFKSVSSAIADALGHYVPKGGRVGFQSDRMSVDEFERLRKSVKGVRFAGIGGAVEKLFIVKQPREISAVTRAAEIGDAAFERLKADIRPGVTEQYCARLLERYCGEFGSEKPSFDTIVLFGARTALPHGKPGTAVLKKGDFVLIDFGCTVNGFASDMTRTLVAGKASKRQKDLYGIVMSAQREACAEAREGMEACEIDALARKPISKAGYGERFGHALGHGVGRRIHEPPRISAQASGPVVSNTIFTIEPGIYLRNFGGVRIEDTVVMKSAGVQSLTQTSRELVEL